MTRTATLRRSFPTLWRLMGLMTAPFRWIGRSRRRLWGAMLVVLAMVAGPPLWWAMQLIGLPDIGDPFDVAAFRALTIPDDRNAFVLYRQAADRLRPWEPSGTWKGKPVDLLARWSNAAPKVRQWVEENREALVLYRQGAERPDALDTSQQHVMTSILSPLHLLALLEGSRLEEQGDMAGAWGWYRAVLRTIHHMGMHGTVVQRLVAQCWQKELRDRLTSWSTDPRTTPALLRQALDDVVACEALAPSESYTIRAEYLYVEQTFDDPKVLAYLGLMSLASRKSLMPVLALLTPEQLQAISDAWRFWRREPERSRRVIRLVTANWLAYYDLPPGERPKPDPEASLAYDFYPFGPDAPAKARVLSPRALGRWLDSTAIASLWLRNWRRSKVRLEEWINHRELLILLGTGLYRREHGTKPPTPEALIGPYLKSLPAEFPDDMRDETIPRAGNTVK